MRDERAQAKGQARARRAPRRSHHYGTFGGRETIYNWIHKSMSEPVNRDMRCFPIAWYIIDEEKGWIDHKAELEASK